MHLTIFSLFPGDGPGGGGKVVIALAAAGVSGGCAGQLHLPAQLQMSLEVGIGQHMYIVAIFHAKQYFVTVANPPLKMQFSKLTFEISRLTFSIH